MTHHGFRVSGVEVGGQRRTEDTFFLRAVAVECAQAIDRAGWTQVRVDEVQRDEAGKYHFVECAWNDAIEQEVD